MNHNQHGVYAADGKIEAGKKLPLTDVGATFYPNLVLLNHSCSPNTIRINEGNRVGDTDLTVRLKTDFFRHIWLQSNASRQERKYLIVMVNIISATPDKTDSASYPQLSCLTANAR